MKRITEQRELAGLAEELGLAADWRRAWELDIDVITEGDAFGDPDEDEDELTAIVFERGAGVAEIGLADLFGWASAGSGQAWAALRDYLEQQVKQDLQVHDEARAAGFTDIANAHGSLVSANRSTLAKMRELEAGQ